MKKFKDFIQSTREKIEKKKPIVGFANLRDPDNAKTNAMLERANDGEIVGVAGLGGLKKLDESFTFNSSVPVEEYNKTGNIQSNSDYPNYTRADEFKMYKEATKHHSQALARMRLKKKHPLREYTDESFGINSELLKAHTYARPINHDLAPEEHLNEIDHIITHRDNALEKPIVTYSGIGKSLAQKSMIADHGDEVHFPAYTSTSIKHDIAHSFSTRLSRDDSGLEHHHKNANGGGLAHVAIFHLPKGFHNGAYIGNVSVHKGEHEFLLGRNQKFKYKGSYYDHKGATVYHHLEPT